MSAISVRHRTEMPEIGPMSYAEIGPMSVPRWPRSGRDRANIVWLSGYVWRWFCPRGFCLEGCLSQIQDIQALVPFRTLIKILTLTAVIYLRLCQTLYGPVTLHWSSLVLQTMQWSELITCVAHSVSCDAHIITLCVTSGTVRGHRLFLPLYLDFLCGFHC